MARTLNADLLVAQTSGYPTGGYAPAVRCILTSKDGVTTHDYSFDPALIAAGSFVIGKSYAIATVGTTDFTLIGASSNTKGVVFTATGVGSGTGIALDIVIATANRLERVDQVEDRESDLGLILLSNYDRSIPTDLNGYYVDLGWGHNTSSGLKYTAADGAVSPRLWVMRQSDISGGQKGARPQLSTLLQMGGAWNAVLNEQFVRLGTTPYFQYTLAEIDNPYYIIPALTNLTIYGVIEYLIETALKAQTGISFTLDALGTQDDGHIDTDIPFPSTENPDDLLRTINADSPGRLETYKELILSLLQLTECMIVPRAGLAFRIIYPQASDTADETYYSSAAKGHPFYEVENRRLNMTPNHIEVFGTDPETTVGDWFDPDHFATAPTRPFTPTAIEDAYTGPFMPVTESSSEEGLGTDVECDAKASALGWQRKDQITGARIIIPMDARVELFDRARTEGQRGH